MQSLTLPLQFSSLSPRFGKKPKKPATVVVSLPRQNAASIRFDSQDCKVGGASLGAQMGIGGRKTQQDRVVGLVSEGRPSPFGWKNRLAGLVASMQSQARKLIESQPKLKDDVYGGSTGSVVIVYPSRWPGYTTAHVASIGDSPVLAEGAFLPNGVKGFNQLTPAHSPMNKDEIARLLRNKHFILNGMLMSENGNRLSVSRSIGDLEFLGQQGEPAIQGGSTVGGLSHTPFIRTYRFKNWGTGKKGDRLSGTDIQLCSDGFMVPVHPNLFGLCHDFDYKMPDTTRLNADNFSNERLFDIEQLGGNTVTMALFDGHGKLGAKIADLGVHSVIDFVNNDFRVKK